MSEPRSGRSPAKPEERDPSSFALEALPWPEVEAHLERDPRLLFAVGALEQHGPHLPLGVNLLIAQRVVETVSRERGVLRAPALAYGVDLPRHRGHRFSGTAGFRRKTLHRAVNELLADWEDHGVEELIVVTAHRYEPHLDAILMAMTAEARTTVVNLRSIPVGDILEGDPDTEHGGELETSLLLHLEPERVRTEQIRDFVTDPATVRRYVRGRAPTPPPGSRGSLGRPSRATPEKGRRVFRRFVEILSREVLAAEANVAGRSG